MRYLLFVLALLLPGCAFSPVKKPDTTPLQLYQATFEGDIFELTTTSLKHLGYQIGLEDKKRGVIKTLPLKVLVQHASDCGTWNGSPVTGTADATLMIHIEDQTVDVEAHIFAHFIGRNLYGAVTREEAYKCRSIGSLESTLLAKMREISNADSGYTTPSSSGAIAPQFKPAPVETHSARCLAITRNGTRCRNMAKTGNRCHVHK